MFLVAMPGSASSAAAQAAPTVFFEEGFEDANLATRGWYDNTVPVVTTAEHTTGSTHSAEFHWVVGGTAPTSGGAMRKKFTPSASVYVSYWVKYGANYTGSNHPYHPHEFMIMTNKNGDWDGPAYSHLTAYIEQNEGVPHLAIQDGQNIDESKVGQDLTTLTENRSVSGCNGVAQDGHITVDCYSAGAGVHWNGKTWAAGGVYFQDASGPYYKNAWHHVEAYFQLNTISAGKGQENGKLTYWYDGTALIDRSDVVFRTGANADLLFNQFLIAPWIGDGSPLAQTFWVDDLKLANARPTGTPAPGPTPTPGPGPGPAPAPASAPKTDSGNGDNRCGCGTVSPRLHTAGGLAVLALAALFLRAKSAKP